MTGGGASASATDVRHVRPLRESGPTDQGPVETAAQLRDNPHQMATRIERSTQPRWPIALIDDDPGVRRSVSRLLSVAGFDVTTFESAEAFLASPQTFRCLILDVQLTGQTGLELYHRLEDAGRLLPAIFITSHEDYLADGTSDGRRMWLRKPFDATDLVAAIRLVVTGDGDQ